MGSTFSFFCSTPAPPTPGFGDLPESCVASVLQYLDPPQICKLAMLNRAFRGASSADCVWESKLPSNSDFVIQRVFNDFPSGLCKRDIYEKLSGQNSLDQGTKKVWMDKSSGKICLAVASTGLAITGIDDRRYWSRVPTNESRFGSVAYLQQIWWFEVDGYVEFPFPAGRYSLFFRLQLGRTSKRFCRKVCNTDDVHGWDKKPVRFQLSTSDGQQAKSECYLDEPGKWVHHHVGDFTVEDTPTPTKIKFSTTQIDCTHTKGGLCVDSVVIYPTELRERLTRF